MKKKCLLTATVQSHICQFHKPLVRMLHQQGYEVHVAARNNLAEKNGLKLDFVENVFDVPFSRSPLSKDNYKAYKQLVKILEKEHYDVIHCNTPMGGVVTRLAAQKYRKKNTEVIYAAHGFHFYKGASLLAWLVYFPIESILGKYYTDKLITISDSDYQMAVKRKICKNIFRIHSVGINESKYHLYSEAEGLEERKSLGISEEDFVCICTGELNKNKRQIQVINALPRIVSEVPHFKLLLAGNGPEHDVLEQRIKDLEMQQYAKLIGYCTNLEDYVKISDVAISASLREGLGINLIEAMACKKPVIGSYNRGHSEFIRDEQNGFLIKSENLSEGIAEAVVKLYKNKSLYAKCAENAFYDAHIYLESQVEKELYKIYFEN